MKKSIKIITIVNATALSLLLVQGCTSTDGRTAGLGQKKKPLDTTPGAVDVDTSWTTPPPPDVYQPPQPTTPMREVVSVYTVVKNDTLSEIALRHSVRTRELAAFNNISNPDKLYIGQQIEIPPPTYTPSSSPRTSSSAGRSSSRPVPTDGNYTVVAGDTIGGIAQRFGLKQADIFADNGLHEKSIIHIGQKLKLRTGGVAPVSIDSAPTLDSDYTPANSYTPTPYESSTRTPVSSGSSAADTAGYNRYVVQEGDDVYSVAIALGVQPTDLRQANNLSGSELIPGQTIKVPIK